MTALLGKIKYYVLTALSVVGFLLWGYWTARSDGKASAKLDNAKARDKLQEHYDEIDRSNIDPAASYDRLRGLSDQSKR